MNEFSGMLGFVQSPVLSNRLIAAFFCLLTFILLLYFYNLARQSSHARRINVRGLGALSLVFLSYALVGAISVFLREEKGIQVLLSGGVNLCLLLSIPFFSHGVSKFDRLSEHPVWKNLGLIFALGYVVLAVLRLESALFITDLVAGSLALVIFGVFLFESFLRRRLPFLAIVCAVSVVVIALIPLVLPGYLEPPVPVIGGKFVHVTTTIIAPALFLSIIAVAMTFSWINELTIRSLARMYSGAVTDKVVNEFLHNHLPKADLVKHWNVAIANDDLETVIEQMIEITENRNESLELILNLASRNSRNNTGRLKEVISSEEYNLGRNKISAGLVQMIESF